jgi:hypothetical protein
MKERVKLLILGHARHGKDTVAHFLKIHYGLVSQSSSIKACEIFLFDALKDKYNYEDINECFKDRVNHRAEWYDLITEYNREDKARLAKEILHTSDMYIGMRDDGEYQECKKQGVFDFTLGVYNPRLLEEDKSSFNIDFWSACDFVIPNNGDLSDLELKTMKVFNKIL